jgi:GMP synthase (glutamine-hydrolysing)
MSCETGIVPGSVLVIQSDPDKSLGRIGDALMRAGVRLDARSPDRELPSVRGYAGLVVLPGLADPVDETPAVRRARGAIVEALAAEMPILGLCLGGQLLVQALGGSVHRCRPELGFRDVLASPAAAGDPLLGGVPPRLTVFHAHAFAFRPPAGAEILLTNDVCVQACRYGEAWALQCHPEVRADWVRALAAGIRGERSPLRAGTIDFFVRNGISANRLERDLERAEPAMRLLAERVADGLTARLGRARPRPPQDVAMNTFFSSV